MAYAEWSPYTVYVVSDIVNYSGANYQALQINKNVVPTTLAPNWAVYSPGGGGGVAIVNDNTNATFFPTFVSGVGAAVSTLNIDSITTPFSFNPSNGNISLATTLKIDTNKTAVGLSAGSGQGANATAIGYQAGATGQGASSVAIGDSACFSGQGASAVAIGRNAANNAAQGAGSIAIGYAAGFGNTIAQQADAIAVGYEAGWKAQAQYAVAIGRECGYDTQGGGAIAIGRYTGNARQGGNAVAVGTGSGNSDQGIGAVAVGVSAGQTTQGAGAIAIGASAAASGINAQQADAIAIGRSTVGSGQGAASIAIGYATGSGAAVGANSIILNASGAAFAPTTASAFFVNPVRNITQTNELYYDTATKEITYATKAYLFTNFPPGLGTATEVYSPASPYPANVLFRNDGITSGYLVVKSSGGLTNTGTNGWIDTAGRFYAPTTGQYMITITIFLSIPINNNWINLEQSNSSGLVSQRLVMWNEPPNVSATNNYQCVYSTILNMTAGDWFECIVNSGSSATLAISYDSEFYTTLQVKQL